MQTFRILIGCEESQAVAKAFRARGFEAYSCDTEPCSGGFPEFHLQCDIFEALENGPWDMLIFFPPCTYFASSGVRWLKDQPPRPSGAPVGAARRQLQQEALDFIMRILSYKIPYMAFENPVGMLSSLYRKPDQIIQPWQFGHGEIKKTGLWLYGLPKLQHTDVVEGRHPRVWLTSPGPERAKERSKTYEGIAQAMASQWGSVLIQNS